MIISITYITYIVISFFITVFVSRTLSKNGEIYLIDGFNGNVELASSVNHMLVVGFYLLNLGFVLLLMQAGRRIIDIQSMIIYLSSNIGLVLLVLGVAHFVNMFVIHKFREVGLRKIANHQLTDHV
jgi:hypothetical protein